MHKFLYKQYYFIEKFDKKHLKRISNKVNLIYRKYNKVNDEKTIKKLVEFCSIEKRKLFLANDFKMALKMRLCGVYLPSFNKSILHNCYKFSKSFKIIGSAHNISEIRTKELQKVEEIFLAPVFKKKKNILGTYGFLKLKRFFKKKTIVLGGVEIQNLKKLRLLDAEGFAAINYYKKKAPKKGP